MSETSAPATRSQMATIVLATGCTEPARRLHRSSRATCRRDGGRGYSAQIMDGLREWVSADFGVDLTRLEMVHFGADSDAHLWRGTSARGDSFAVKLSGGGTAAGLIVSAELVRHGVAGVPAPRRTVDGRLWSDRDGRRLSLVPWVSDTRAYDGGTTASHWKAFGELLAGLHGMAVTDELARVLPRETHTHEWQAVLTHALDRRLRGVT